MRSAPTLAIAAVVMAMIIAMVMQCEGPRAQDQMRGHHENHDWYKSLQAPGGGSCCNGDVETGDCRWARLCTPAEGGEGAVINGECRPIPWQAILPDHLNKDPLHAHICAQRETGYIYCFLRGGAGG